MFLKDPSISHREIGLVEEEMTWYVYSTVKTGTLRLHLLVPTCANITLRDYISSGNHMLHNLTITLLIRPIVIGCYLEITDLLLLCC